jgi:hypothetical protein
VTKTSSRAALRQLEIEENREPRAGNLDLNRTVGSIDRPRSAKRMGLDLNPGKVAWRGASSRRGATQAEQQRGEQPCHKAVKKTHRVGLLERVR